MEFKGPAGKEINRLGFKFTSDQKGILSVDVDSLKKRFTEVDEEGNENTVREAVTEDEKKDLVSTFKAYGFNPVVKEAKEAK